MPGYVIHLTEAEMIRRQLEKKGLGIAKDKKWYNSFFYGALLPDASIKEYKAESHFWDKKLKDRIVMVPRLEVFQEKYENLFTDPVVGGYFAHLHLDYYFFTEYLMRMVVFLNAHGEKEEHLSQVREACIVKSGKCVSIQDFFSEKYLYGDYTKLNTYLIKAFDLNGMVDCSNVSTILVKEAQPENMQNVIDKLGKFISIGRKQQVESLNVFTIDSLIEFLEKASREIVEMYCGIETGTFCYRGI